MKFLTLAALAAMLACTGALAQEEAQKVELKVIVTGDGGDQPTEVHWVGQDLDLDDLEVGETRTVTGESGDTITVTRTAEGMQFDVDGETVVVPDIGLHGGNMAFVGTSGEQDFDIDIRSDAAGTFDVTAIDTHAISAAPAEGVTIISGEPLDDSVRESIRSVLISAGVDDEVRFIDHAAGDGEVRVVTKKVEVIR